MELYNTLHAALESEGLEYVWPEGILVRRGEIVMVAASYQNFTVHITVERRLDGQYEKPEHFTE